MFLTLQHSSLSFFLASIAFASAFSPLNTWGLQRQSAVQPLQFFDKIFEEEGPLGKGITVGKVQIALIASERGPDSIFGGLERGAKNDDDLPALAHDICLALLRRSDDWTAACSEGQWFKQDDAGKGERLFNDWANKEAIKFEKVW
jgi:hypothetical protein